MEKSIDLLNGNILTFLTELALPIIAASLVQTAYSLTDMAWIGMVGSGAVTAVGVAAAYTWLSSGVAVLARIGRQVESAHAYGGGNRKEAVQYGKGALQLTLVLAAAYGIIANLFTGPLIGFFYLNSSLMIKDAIVYLRVACGLILFAFIGRTLTGLYTASDNSRTPFVANCIGMEANIILNPLLIFGLGPVHGMGAAGAAVAAVAAQFTVSLVLVISIRKDPVLAAQVWIWIPTPLSNIKTMVRIGFPAIIQSMLHYGTSIALTRFVTAWGDMAVAVQRVGGQIESISWMTADGFGTATNAFIRQNRGAGSLKRVREGYMTASAITFMWGIFTTCLLIFGAAPIFNLFIHEPEVIPAEADYLRIIEFSEVFMCAELMTMGTPSGIGKTMEASVITIILTTAHIPLIVIPGGTAPGLNSIWWALTISGIVKGIIFFGCYPYVMERMEVQVPRLIYYGLTTLLYRMNL